MSERGQKIFKWIVWIIILSLFVYKVYSVGKSIVEEDNPVSMSHDASILEPVEPIEIDKDDLGVLSADADALVLGETNEVQFVVMANPKMKDVELYCNDELVGIMSDDGSAGDSKRGDGYYSYICSVNPSQKEIRSYYAKLGNKKSNVVELTVYSAPTEEDLNSMQNTINVIVSLEDDYSEDGYIPTEKYDEFIDNAYLEALNYANDNNIGIAEIEKTDDGLYVLFESGIQYVYTIKKEGNEEGDDEVYLSVRNLEPYLTSGNGELASLASFAGSAELIDETLDGAVFDMNYTDADVTFDNIKEAFKPNSFIIWHGHGGYSKKSGSFLGTGVEATTVTQLGHTTDLIAGRMLVTGDGRIAITYKYFNKYIDDLSNSFVYLGGCHTGQDSYLMSVMIWKNADVSVGFSDSVLTRYDCNVMKTMTEELCTKNSETDRYKTIGEALNVCVNYYGIDDGDDTPAKLMYMGDSEYRIDNLIPQKWNPPSVDIDSPDLDQIGKDVQDKVDKKIDDTVDSVLNSLANKLQNAIDKWFMETCGGC